MSSATSTTTTDIAAPATTTFNERQTHWCHLCAMSVSILPSSPAAATTTTSVLCPYCNTDYLQQLDSPLFSSNNSNPNESDQNSSHILFPSFFDPSIPTTTGDSTTTFHFPSVTTSDDNFLLDSPYLHRLIHHLTNSDDSSASTTTTTTSRHHSPAAKSAIEAIPLVKITSSFLEIDPVVFCAVCKDQFVIDDDTKQLPCKHMYHPDCILPWLSQHNSCPVCRFQLPRESVSGDLRVRRSRSRVFRLGDLMADDDDEEVLNFGLRQLTRRHRLVFPMSHQQYRQPEVEPEVLFPSTQMEETFEVDVPDSGRANRLETLPSWPNWPVDGGAVDGGEVDVGAAWVDDADVALH